MSGTEDKETDMDTTQSPAEEPTAGENADSGVSANGAPDAEALEKLEKEKKQYFEQLLRLKAEYENYRKRVDREKPELIRHGKVEVLERMIPLYDVLLAAHEQVAQSDGPQNELVRGLEMIFEEFTKLFEAEGVAVIASVGERYDFDRHEVLGQVETDEYDEGVVVEELQRGYLIGGKVVRAAKVRIAKKG
jgi:molecular chaperone GrpE